MEYVIAGQDTAVAQSMRKAIYASIDIFEARSRWAKFSSNPLPHYEREKGRDISVRDMKLPEVTEDK